MERRAIGIGWPLGDTKIAEDGAVIASAMVPSVVAGALFVY